MKRLEKRLEKEKKSQKLQKELDKFPVKQKEKLEAIRTEGRLGNKKAGKQARTNRRNKEFKGLDKNGNTIRGIKQHQENQKN